jgi:hypothetical protein
MAVCIVTEKERKMFFSFSLDIQALGFLLNLLLKKKKMFFSFQNLNDIVVIGNREHYYCNLEYY